MLGLLADAAQQRLLDLAAMCEKTSYEALSEEAFGRAGKISMALVTLVTTFAGTMSYLGAAKELLVGAAYAFMVDVDVSAIGGGAQALPRPKAAALLLALVALVMPRLFSSTMSSNSCISTATVFTISASALYFVLNSLFVIINGCDVEVRCGAKPSLFHSGVSTMLTNVATLAFSFSMIFAVFPVLQDRVEETGSVPSAVRQLKPAVRLSVALSCLIYLAVGLTGSFAFGDQVRAVALTNLDLRLPVPLFINLVVGTCGLLLVAIIAFPTIQSLELLCSLVCPNATRSLRTPFVLLVGVSAALIDAFVDTKVALALTGSLGLALSAYVVPSAIFMKLSAPTNGALLAADHEQGRARLQVGLDHWLLRAVSATTLVFGLLLVLGATPAIVYKVLTSRGTASTGNVTSLVCDVTQEGLSGCRWN